MWAFCLRSLLREYGWQFLRHVALPHPVKTARAVFRSGTLDFSGVMTEVRPGETAEHLGARRAVVGVGFCMKPMNPACMSGPFNHDCRYLEQLVHGEARSIPACCRECAIREIGTMALQTGAAFYIMTSARDILFDLFKPALDGCGFASGLFVLCRYSLRPFAVGMLVSGIRGRMLTFETGDCRDYKTWLLADRGTKDERTSLDETSHGTLAKLLADSKQERLQYTRFVRRGNMLYPANS